MFLVLICCLSDFPSDYSQSIKRICMKSLPEVCLKPKKQRVRFGEDDLNCDPDLDYYPDLIWISQICMKLLSKVCLWPRSNPLNCGDDLDYDLDLG